MNQVDGPSDLRSSEFVHYSYRYTKNYIKQYLGTDLKYLRSLNALDY